MRSSPGVAPPFLGEMHCVVDDLADHRHDVGEFAGHFLVTDSQYHVRPVEDFRLVFFWNAHHVADDLQRQQAGGLGDEVGFGIVMLG